MKLFSASALISSFVLAVAPVVSAQTPEAPAKGSVVRVEGDKEKGFTLMRDGKPYVIKGVGGSGQLDLLAACGGNTIRTWGIDALAKPENGKPLIDYAHENGIAVVGGIWLGHERHGFKYDDPAMLEKQRKEVEEAVRKYKDHPALLAWGLGNEMEGPVGPGTNPLIWKEINHLAKLIKSIDANHPVMPVVANVSAEKVKAILENAPDIDILGVNVYAGAGGVGGTLRRSGWEKPYCITEFGLPGPWEVGKTSWGEPVEPSSREKASTYFVAYETVMSDTARCFGTFAFLWGNKQEVTSSWFGMLLPGGEKTMRVDAMAKAWTGNFPANRAPVLQQADIPVNGKKVPPSTEYKAIVKYKDHDGDTLQYVWEVLRESTQRGVGGEAEAKPEAVPAGIVDQDQEGNVTLRTPEKLGKYRLFVTVKDGKGSGCMENWPFLVATP